MTIRFASGDLKNVLRERGGAASRENGAIVAGCGVAIVAGCGVAILAGCGGAPPPVPEPPPNGAAPVPEPGAPGDDDAAAAADPIVRMHPVQRIASLFGVLTVDGQVWVRLGELSAGQFTEFRYAPIVDGRPDLERETGPVLSVNTAAEGGYWLHGTAPNLLVHTIEGFRSAGVDGYLELDALNQWQTARLDAGDGRIGAGIFPWTKGRMLEIRRPPFFAPDEDGSVPATPSIRVVRGGDRRAPRLTPTLERTLERDRFSLENFTVLRHGAVLLVGTTDGGIATVLWRDDASPAKYFATPEPAAGLEILGGESLADLRLFTGTQVMRLVGDAWIAESEVALDGHPDVWFGRPLVRDDGAGLFARLAAGQPWRPVERHSSKKYLEESFAVGPDGTIWKTEEDVLYASRPPAQPFREVPEDEVVAGRKASVLRGGELDALGIWYRMNWHGENTCRMLYVLLQAEPETQPEHDYPRVRQVLRGQNEYADARFVISRERGMRFFGALLADRERAENLAARARWATSNDDVRVICAEPPAERELRIDLATGDLLP
jgi:hypothetical protein